MKIDNWLETTETIRLSKALELLNDLFEQTDQDCPQEYRTRHLVETLEEVESFLVDLRQRTPI
tara:strand:+ start:218 stop:406 length:189 start_codon:yes stop_codon:yes gene_type:complete